MTLRRDSLSIRRAEPEDAAAMLAVGAAADRLFAGHGFPQIAELPPTSLADFRDMLAGSEAWVALLDGRPAGFALAGEAAGSYWLKELAVDPAQGRRGIGTALLATIVAHARAVGRSAIVLSTFREVPFNRPFYARHGFADMEPESAPVPLRAQFLREVPPGVDPAARILMIRRL